MLDFALCVQHSLRAVFTSIISKIVDRIVPNLSKQCFLLICFRMVKTFDCIKCGGHHTRPINRNCKIEKDKNEPMDTNSQILKELNSLSGRMTQMEDKMEALGSTSASPVKSHTPSLHHRSHLQSAREAAHL